MRFWKGEYKEGRFCQFWPIKSVENNLKWGIINVYGPIQTMLKADFLRELMDFIITAEFPMIMVGDFNLVREAAEKSNGIIN